MSGGHFEYVEFQIEEAAREIARIVRINGNVYPIPDAFGYAEPSYNYPPDIIERFKETSVALQRAAAMLRRVDYLVCGDDGEDSFRRRWKEEVEDKEWSWGGEGI
jgi:hypothetical protein